jgi:hypothetical protein
MGLGLRCGAHGQTGGRAPSGAGGGERRSRDAAARERSNRDVGDIDWGNMAGRKRAAGCRRRSLHRLHPADPLIWPHRIPWRQRRPWLQPRRAASGTCRRSPPALALEPHTREEGFQSSISSMETRWRRGESSGPRDSPGQIITFARRLLLCFILMNLSPTRAVAQTLRLSAPASVLPPLKSQSFG